MKKIKSLLVGILLMPLLMLTVHAASAPYAWVVGDETLGPNKANTSNTASQVTDGQTVTLTLENYNGGKLELTCYGTSQEGMTFIIELKGENVITADDVGIQYTYDSELQFKGDGKLTVNAPKPASYSSEETQLVIEPNKSSETTDEKPTTTEDDDDDEDDEEEKTEEDAKEITTTGENHNIRDFFIGFGIGIGLILIYAIIKKAVTSKKEKAPVPAATETPQVTPAPVEEQPALQPPTTNPQ